VLACVDQGKSSFVGRAGIEQIKFSDLITIVYSVRVARVPPIRPREFFPSKAIEPAPKTDDFSQRAVCCSAHSNFNLTAIDALVYRKPAHRVLASTARRHLRRRAQTDIVHSSPDPVSDLRLQGPGQTWRRWQTSPSWCVARFVHQRLLQGHAKSLKFAQGSEGSSVRLPSSSEVR